MREPRGVEWLWYSPDVGARAVRSLLAPFELAYGGVVALRGKLYDSGVLPTRAAPIPALSVGNLTVGGTGKTPISAWLANELAERGAKPAVVLRGYGSDETLVHRQLNGDAPVVASADRAAGIELAAQRGCDVAVLDDAFQHRRAGRTADVVLVSTERWSERRHLLPAGPWREPLAALRRASLVIVTRKSASPEAARQVAGRVAHAAAGVPVAVAHLAPRELRSLCSDTAVLPLGALAGRRVLAISAIGDPHAFEAQLAALAATVESRAFPDHHRFTAGEVARLSRTAAELARHGGDGLPVVLCTLKDAVKLSPGWPREAPRLWYVSQQPEVESGRAELEALITRTLAARHRQP
ncbi:MAG TPA: tetraacyldisaccharide 4'-kinase [Gemmatimonadaceae bacterium]|nr:tetraacyldisaccharide 4'-kinase [Gemmatimonadaceae bacterium]